MERKSLFHTHFFKNVQGVTYDLPMMYSKSVDFKCETIKAIYQNWCCSSTE